MTRSARRTLPWLVVPFLCNCNGLPIGGQPSTPVLNLTPRSMNVTVAPPTGLAMPAIVRTSLGKTDVASGAANSTRIFNDGPQFAMATDAVGNPQLLGFIAPNSRELNTHTTAEVLLFFSLNAPLLPGAEQELILHDLKTLPAVQTLADAIGAALAADGLALVRHADSIKTALHHAREQIVNGSRSSASAHAKMLIDPSDGRSGITVTQLGLNSINIRNDFRRRAYYFLEVLSYVPEGGGAEVPSHLDVSEGNISPTAGATSAFGAISDIFAGTQAYTGVDSGAIDVPIVPNNADSTTYRVTVVGIGAHAGDEGGLSDAQTSRKRQIILESFVVDFFVPFFVDVIMPINANQVDNLLNLTHGSDLVAGLISAVGNAAPLAVEKALSGDLAGGLLDLYSNLLADGSARLLVLQGLYELLTHYLPFYDHVDFTELGEQVLKGVDAVDSILIGFDSLVQTVQIASSSRAETWRVVSDRSKVKLSPEQGDIGKTQSQVFTATIPGATGTDATIVYHWSNTGQHGGISDGQHTGTSFDSTINFVSYTGATAGNDTITVEAFQVQGQNRTSIGTAHATVKVRDLAPRIAPDRISLNHNESHSFAASVDAGLTNGGTLTYKWFSPSKFGQITQPLPYVETTINTATYQATGTPPGNDTLAVEVFSTKDGVKTSLGIARAQIKLEQRKTIIIGSFEVVVQFAQPGFTGTPGYSFVTAYAKVPKVEGATSYSCRIYNFYDPAYYGHGTTFGDGIVRGREDRGNEYWIGLTGGQARDDDVAATVAATASRFTGIIVEVTVTY